MSNPLGELPKSIPRWQPPESYIKFYCRDNQKFNCKVCQVEGQEEGFFAKNLKGQICNRCKMILNKEGEFADPADKPEPVPPVGPEKKFTAIGDVSPP